MMGLFILQGVPRLVRSDNGGAITPSLNFMYSEVRTINSPIDLGNFLTTKGAGICDEKGVTMGGAGFSRWIGSVVTSINDTVAGNLKTQMTQFVYGGDFVVNRGASDGVAVNIVPVKATASAGSSRSDIQHLKVTIAPVNFVRGKKNTDGGRNFAAEPGDKLFELPATSLNDIKTCQRRRGTFNIHQH